MHRIFRSAILLPFALLVQAAYAQDFKLTLLHTNDLHAHMDPIKIGSGMYGGYAKQATLLKRFSESDPNPLIVSAGDSFQGTIFFRIFRGLSDGAMMNLMGYRAMAVGNHEFDLGPKGLAAFIAETQFPLLCCNIDVSQDPDLKGKVLPETVVTVGGQKIGLIGAVTPDLPTISSPGPTVKMLDLNSSLRKCVLSLESQGVDKIVLLSHLGYDVEQKVASEVGGIDVIVGGHSHTLIGDCGVKDFPASQGPYPTIVKRGNHTTVLVTAWDYGKILGRITVTFDAMGEITDWTKTQPIAIESSIPDDPLMASFAAAFREPANAFKNKVVGSLGAELDGSRTVVRSRESTMGDVVADSMVWATRSMETQLALMNGGGVRASIASGPVTYEEVVNVQPFGNTLVVINLTGAEIIAALNHGLTTLPEGGGFLQVSKGLQVEIDMSRPAGRQVTSVKFNGQPIDPRSNFKVVINSFSAGGGDGFDVFKQSQGARTDTGIVDVDALVDYLATKPNLIQRTEGRILVKSGIPEWLLRSGLVSAA